MVKLLADTPADLVRQLLPWVDNTNWQPDLYTPATPPPPIGTKPSRSTERGLPPLITLRAPTFDPNTAPHVPVPTPLSAESRALVAAVYGPSLPAQVDPVDRGNRSSFSSAAPELVDADHSWRRIVPPFARSRSVSPSISPVAVTLRGESYQPFNRLIIPNVFSIMGHHAILHRGHFIDVFHDDLLCLQLCRTSDASFLHEIILSIPLWHFPGLVTRRFENAEDGTYTRIGPCSWDFPPEYKFSILVEDGDTLDLSL
jgi:hypothetical protein